eukprot:1139412-Pelagomonas_calceolata.AAC.7
MPIQAATGWCTSACINTAASHPHHLSDIPQVDAPEAVPGPIDTSATPFLFTTHASVQEHTHLCIPRARLKENSPPTGCHQAAAAGHPCPWGMCRCCSPPAQQAGEGGRRASGPEWHPAWPSLSGQQRSLGGGSNGGQQQGKGNKLEQRVRSN